MARGKSEKNGKRPGRNKIESIRPEGRRAFLQKTGLAALGFAAGAAYLDDGGWPAQPVGPLPGKHPGLIVLNDKPINAETPPELLADSLTPNDRFFVRNNGVVPANLDATNWTLTVGGEAVRREKSYTLTELKTKFPVVTYHLTLECGGNGRKEFNPPATGNQWATGAVGCAAWTGVRLRDVLQDVGITDRAVYVAYYGKDTHLSGDPAKVVISRGVPVAKALEEESLIAWSMNGKDLPVLNGYPLRLVIGGYPASVSGKWLDRLVVRDRIHDGEKMLGQSYRVPCSPVPPGAKVADEDMCIIEEMPVKSLITFPKTGAMLRKSQTLPLGGHAWAASSGVARVEYSIDFGATWQACTLAPAANRYAWQDFSARISFPSAGYFEVWARATDGAGVAQPMLVPGWNPRGYLNNACHRIAVKVIA
ncbi:sulfite oxidase [Neolewinella lacunae]|uniref:Sulfite oxidase n=1 Tax=Neolewinella lacunae TaxID=1517758 RepID=A0A923T761_9BACT|nr:sulfite oxidase [Neolewinella lacunae]MBC6993234.1 sulfite oxidase [Neolewinella lacunae]MDN3635719.1 sulfite oxidase [Neolewinella lacunae]